MARAFRYGSISGSSGAWADVTNRYLGLKFTIAGETHFGWARLSVGNNLWQSGTVVLTGYAYETIANKNIIEGHVAGLSDSVPAATGRQSSARQPASLGALAQGAGGLALWRREDISAN